MAHIAFFIAPLSGRINPTLAVVRELAERGHRVTYATTSEHAARTTAAGARTLTHRTTLRETGHAPSFTDRFTADDFVRAQRGQLREASVVVPELAAAFAGDIPDMTVCDPLSWAGRVLASRWQVPVVKTVTTLVGGARWSFGRDYASFDPAHRELPSLFARVSRFLRESGARLTADKLFATDDAIPVLAYHPRAFQVDGDSFGAHVHFVGPCLPGPESGPGPAPEKPPWRPPPGKQVVLVSFGTIFNDRAELFRRCVAAVASPGRHVVVSMGGRAPDTLHPVTPGAGLEVHQNLPLTQVLAHAALFVSHGAMRSTMEALSFAVPIVAMPRMPEQRANAERLAELGLGVHLAAAGAAREEIRREAGHLIGNDAVRARLAWMRAEIERAGGARAAADVIERVADEASVRRSDLCVT